jgi:hypothetical protein
MEDCEKCKKEQIRMGSTWDLCEEHYKALIDSGKKDYDCDFEADLRKDLVQKGHHED